MTSCLYDYQKPASEQLIRALQHGQAEWGYSAAADLSDVGTGKTWVDLVSMLAVRDEIVVLCPNVGIMGWQKTFKALDVTPRYIGSYESIKLGGHSEIALRTANGFKWRNAERIGLILDEAQLVKGADTLAAQCIDGAIQARIPIIAASATLASSPLEMYILGQILGLHKGGRDWERFMAEYGCAKDEETGEWRWIRRAGMMERLHHIILPQRGCRMRKEDMGERPECTISDLPLDSPNQRKLQDAWRAGMEDMAKLQKKGYPRQVWEGLRRKIRTRLWKESEMTLVPILAERIKQDLDNDHSIVVFLNFTESRELLGRLLNRREGLYGGMSVTQRNKVMSDFSKDRLRVLLCQIKAGGAAANLQDVTGKHPRIMYIMPSDSAIAMGQCPGRIDRSGARTPSQVFILSIRNTMTEGIIASTAKKVRNMAKLNDGKA